MGHRIEILIIGLILSLGASGANAGHFKGKEVNVVVIECHVPTTRVQETFKGRDYVVAKPVRPPSIRVRAISFNATSAPIPTVTENDSCAQALHEHLTAGFELVRGVSIGPYVYTLTREDKSASPH